jgi:hypothetical protein
MYLQHSGNWTGNESTSSTVAFICQLLGHEIASVLNKRFYYEIYIVMGSVMKRGHPVP